MDNGENVGRKKQPSIQHEKTTHEIQEVKSKPPKTRVWCQRTTCEEEKVS